MNFGIRVQLSLMMFMQFCVWGAWYGQMSKYLTVQLNATGDQVGSAYAAFSIAMIASPFFIGLLADRFFSAQHLLGALNLLGALFLFWLTNVEDADSFFWVMLMYSLTFAPTVALTSSIALRQMVNPEKEFPTIRVFGTIAFIFIINLVGFLGVGDQVMIFRISMFIAAALGIFAFFLPSTPPSRKSSVNIFQIIGKDAFVLFRDRSFLIFFISSILICIPLSFYYTWANPSLTDAYRASFPATDASGFNIESKMSLGQVSEVLFMLLLPLAYSRLKVKRILTIGLLAWIIRFLFFGFGNADAQVWMLYTAILLHGICFDFFFVTGQIYTNQKSGIEIKSQAQGLITLATFGIGMLIGSIIAGKVKDKFTIEGVTNWTQVWLTPATIATLVLILFVLLFKEEKNRTQSDNPIATRK